MVENVRPPVAIRIVRPYQTEAELLERELETITKSSVVLIGAQPRPTGVILRFEVTLASGATLLRGEGRVLLHKEDAFRGQPGLTLRFTRLDPRSKGLVDRAAAMREARPGAPASPSRPPLPSGPVADALTASTPAPAPASAGSAPASSAEPEAAVERARATAREKANATARANARRTRGSAPPSARPQALTPPPLPVSTLPVRDTSEEPPAPLDTQPPSLPEVESGHDGPAQLDTIPPSMPDVESGHAVSTARPSGPEAELPEPPPSAPDAEDGPALTPEPTPVTSIPGEVRYGPGPAAPVPELQQPHASAGARPSAPGAPGDRAAVLARLRERARSLDPARVEEILAARARQG